MVSCRSSSLRAFTITKCSIPRTQWLSSLACIEFLLRKWYFDELYSVLLVHPSLAVAHWCKNFDLKGIDWVLHGSAKATVTVSRWNGAFDKGVIDGLANLTARVFYATGSWLKNVQTGFLRSYILFSGPGGCLFVFPADVGAFHGEGRLTQGDFASLD